MSAAPEHPATKNSISKNWSNIKPMKPLHFIRPTGGGQSHRGLGLRPRIYLHPRSDMLDLPEGGGSGLSNPPHHSGWHVSPGEISVEQMWTWRQKRRRTSSSLVFQLWSSQKMKFSTVWIFFCSRVYSRNTVINIIIIKWTKPRTIKSPSNIFALNQVSGLYFSSSSPGNKPIKGSLLDLTFNMWPEVDRPAKEYCYFTVILLK